VSRVVSRFAPSTTGPAHPGTLLAGLLCWLDARSRDARLILRLEDLDPERCRPEFAQAFADDLAWLGLDWDARCLQSEAQPRHEAALERLAATGLLYPCACSRKEVRAAGQPAPDGGFRYPGTCRTRPLPEGAWRGCGEPLRMRLEPGTLAIRDESGADLSLDPWEAFGDPIVVRRDSAVAYRLASVVDDAAEGVNRVVRGRDLALTTAPQVALQRVLGLATPVYRHHLLLLEDHGGKLAKFHGAVSAAALRARYTSEELCGFLAHAAGLRPDANPVTPAQLLADFAWQQVDSADRSIQWHQGSLTLHPAPAFGDVPA
jgi:glutamyl-tRNA synthetase/glutamyl-Q tRNA(Asp) synthetase